MEISLLCPRTPGQIAQLCALWEASVRATHHFLQEEDIRRIAGLVPEALEQVPRLLVAWREDGSPAGFLGADGDSLEMLFLAPEERGQGLGRRLVEEGIRRWGLRWVSVNEQNPQAVGFYQHLGFVLDHRTETDPQGDPFPILYLRREPV